MDRQSMTDGAVQSQHGLFVAARDMQLGSFLEGGGQPEAMDARCGLVGGMEARVQQFQPGDNGGFAGGGGAVAVQATVQAGDVAGLQPFPRNAKPAGEPVGEDPVPQRVE
ncbi:hypothetical protein GCM10023081_09500 [Arthrobacter ginkgonis]|uniref:Uncharacterized protein n=1 Tax=Arthrobacter ginkgonis TaxID=1630594 RepID=A0ABP7BY16_9MICC